MSTGYTTIPDKRSESGASPDESLNFLSNVCGLNGYENTSADGHFRAFVVQKARGC